MKKKAVALILLVIIVLTWQCQPMKKKVPFAFFIDESSLAQVININGIPSGFNLEAIIILFNNSADTLIRAAQWAPDSRFYYVDNKNLVINDDHDYPDKPDTIAPHHGIYRPISFRFKKLPDTTFSFRIGIPLLKWRKSDGPIKFDHKKIEQVAMLWSDIEVVKTDRKHRGYDKTLEEYKRIYKKKYENIIDPLTENDRKNYILTIDKSRIKKVKDTVAQYFDSVAHNKHQEPYYQNGGFEHLIVPFKFENQSNKTLEYISMTCSWSDMYITNNKNAVIVGGERCLGNSFTTASLLPHQTIALNIDVLLDKRRPHPCKFKIGLTMLRCNIDNLGGGLRAANISFQGDANYTIWSNEIEIP